MENLSDIIGSAINGLTNLVIQKTNDIYYGIKNYDYSMLVARAILLYSQIVVITKKIGLFIYKSHPFIKNNVDTTVYFFEYVKGYLTNKKIEPFKQNWIRTTVQLNKVPIRNIGEEFTIVESYDYLDDASDASIVEKLKESKEIAQSITNSSKKVVESLVTMRVNDRYSYQLIRKTEKDDKDEEPESVVLKPCKFEFLSIEYVHPKCLTRIPIELKKSEYIENNKILSPLFVQNCLEYQTEPFYFDFEYTINIIDHNLETIVLNSKQHIVLYKKTYSIVSASN